METLARAAELQAARGFRPAGLGEVAIRCRDIDAMTGFYRDVIGLELLSRRPNGITFFRIAPGVAGHTCVLALFPDDAAPETGPASSLHHLALSLTPAAQDAALDWYARIGLPCRVEAFDWIGWRGVFAEDPEGNTVELVAHIPRTDA